MRPSIRSRPGLPGLLAVLLAAAPIAAPAAELAGVQLDDRIRGRDDTALELHGAGLREKFFIDVYVGALYLPRTGQSVERIRGTDQPGRVEMHFVYDEVSQEKLADAWREGFAANNPSEVRETIAERIETFIGLFPAAGDGDVFAMEYLPGDGTAVMINGETVGTIAGGEFFRALLAVWVGPEPPDADLRRGMLGQR